MADAIERIHPDGFSYVIAAADYAPGELILSLGEASTVASDPRRLQLSGTKFLLPPQIAHLCEPTAYIDWRDLTLRALTSIPQTQSGKTDLDVGYHFATSEWEGYPAFACLCGSLACVGTFSGCASMTPESLDGLEEYYRRLAAFLPNPPKDFFSPYVRSKR